MNELQKYKMLIDEVEDSITEIDPHGNMVFANNATAKIWGRTKEELLGTNYKSFMDAANREKVYEAYSKVYGTGNPGFVSYELLLSDGSRRVIEDSVRPLRNQDEEIVGFLVVGRDITEHKKVEKELSEHRSRLETIFSSVKEAIITVDMMMNITETNQAAKSICGIDMQGMKGKSFEDCLSQCSRSCKNVLEKTLNKKSPIKEYRIECDHQQHRGQLVSVTSAPLEGTNGQYLGAVLVIRDISLLRNLERELRERHQFHNLIGRSNRMQAIYGLLEDLANLETTVLITGESGTGKELVARALHYSGRRAFKPLVVVNCSALTESLLESELFGHVKGAFTGAINDKQGRFEAADGGTLLLDEIGDISPLIQLKLLRVLQEKTIERVGSSKSRKVDVRVIACTNKDLRERVRHGEFREDLYYRIKVVEVGLPPLRERREDLPLLIDHLCRIFNKRFKKNVEGISQEVLQMFMNYPWHGNIRELEHAMEHAFILCRGRVITCDNLPEELRDFRVAERTAGAKVTAPQVLGAGKVIDALNKVRWNKTKAAKLLGINRRTLHRKILQFQINQDN